jgi:hypothetical protein
MSKDNALDEERNVERASSPHMKAMRFMLFDPNLTLGPSGAFRKG